MIEPIERLDDPRLDAYLRLTELQLRNRLEPEKGIFIAESEKVIDRALAAGHEPLSLLIPDHKLAGLGDLIQRVQQAAPADIPVFVAPAEQIERITGYELTRGILCAMRRPQLPSVEKLLANARRVAVLEDITNHTNVGAIFRSAAALNVDAVLITPGCCDPLYRRAIRVSMGTVFQVPWTRIGEPVADWPEAGMARLHALGFKTAALALKDDSVSLDDPALNAEPKLALVFGTEGDGLTDATIAHCDYTVRIPMAHGVDSLNVAAASAVTFWQLR
jgi:tRNA G18 (ribose-2'-O)-methylase SpoU